MREGLDPYDGIEEILANTKDYEEFSYRGETFIKIPEDELALVDRKVYELSDYMWRNIGIKPMTGWVEVDAIEPPFGCVFEFKLLGKHLLIKNRLMKLEGETDTMASDWRRNYEERVKANPPPGKNHGRNDRGKHRFRNGILGDDATPTSSPTNNLHGVDGMVLGRVQGASRKRRDSRRGKGDYGVNPNTGLQKNKANFKKTKVNKNLHGNTREGDLDAHLQARRDAMPKMGLDAARANVQAALHRNPGESRKEWSKRKAKAIGDFVGEKLVDARLPIIDAMREITGKDSYDESVDIPLAMQTSYGRVFAKHQDIDRDFVNPTLQILADNGLDIETLDTYLVAMHASAKEHLVYPSFHVKEKFLRKNPQ